MLQPQADSNSIGTCSENLQHDELSMQMMKTWLWYGDFEGRHPLPNPVLDRLSETVSWLRCRALLTTVN